MQSFLSVLDTASGALLSGFIITIAVSAAAIAAGALLGIVFGLALTFGGRLLAFPFRVVVDVVRGTPVLVLILATYYMPSGLGLSPGPITAGIIALTVFCASHVGETLRGAFLAIPPAQTDAARAIGLTFGQMLGYVLMPQAIRQIAPNFVNTAVEIVKGVVAPLGDRGGRAAADDAGGHRPHLQDDGVLCARRRALSRHQSRSSARAAAWLERRFRIP